MSGGCQREDLQIPWEVKNNANKKPQIKLQPGAIQSLQLFSPESVREGATGKNDPAQLCIMPKKGMLLQACRAAACMPVEDLIQPQPFDFSKLLFCPRKVILLQEHK